MLCPIAKRSRRVLSSEVAVCRPGSESGMDLLTMPSVLLGVRKEPLNRLLTIVVFLALDNDLFAAVNELVPTLLREVLPAQELFATVELVGSFVFMLLGNTIGKAVTHAFDLVH